MTKRKRSDSIDVGIVEHIKKLRAEIAEKEKTLNELKTRHLAFQGKLALTPPGSKIRHQMQAAYLRAKRTIRA
jgi:hypothetical protein